MANYSVLKAAVAAVVKTNGNQEITGANMQSTLISIINSLGTGYQFMGVATPSTSPGTPDYNVAYIGGAGTYANFGTSVTVPVGSIGVFKYNGSWVKEQIALFAGIDDVPTYGSDNLVKSGGVYNSISDLGNEVHGGFSTRWQNDFSFATGSSISETKSQVLVNIPANTTFGVKVKISPITSINTNVLRIRCYDEDGNMVFNQAGFTPVGEMFTAEVSVSVEVVRVTIYVSNANVLTNGNCSIVCGYGYVQGNTEKIAAITTKLDTAEDNIEHLQSMTKRISQYDGKAVALEYSVIGTIPGNTEAHFLQAISDGYKFLKADMRLTSDNKIVLCHDEGYTFDNNGRITAFNLDNFTPIHSYTLNQVLALEFATQVDDQYIHPCTLDRFLYLCKKNGCVPFITYRHEDWESTTAQVMYSLLQKYEFTTKAIINIYPVRVGQAAILNALDKDLMICDTVLGSWHPSYTMIDNAISNGCQIICFKRNMINPDTGEFTDMLVDFLTDELRTYAANNGIRIWAWDIRTQAEYDELIGAGVHGCSIQARNVN